MTLFNNLCFNLVHVKYRKFTLNRKCNTSNEIYRSKIFSQWQVFRHQYCCVGTLSVDINRVELIYFAHWSEIFITNACFLSI